MAVRETGEHWHLIASLAKAGLRPKSVLCHVTRNGAEQQFFRERLPKAEIIGTEISDTATQFPMAIQWDFHEVRLEWRSAFVLVFSNSWDHTYDPDKLFPTWLSCVAGNGALVLEWSTIYLERRQVRSIRFAQVLKGWSDSSIATSRALTSLRRSSNAICQSTHVLISGTAFGT